MSKKEIEILDELIDSEGNSFLRKVERHGNGEYPHTVNFFDFTHKNYDYLWKKKMDPLDLEPTPTREFHLVTVTKVGAIYREREKEKTRRKRNAD